MKASLEAAILNPLPSRYAAWMDELLAEELPHETRATCGDCAMCGASSSLPSAGPDSRSDGRFFEPEVKCCSFLPTLWNFLVGDLLADESPEAEAGRATVERRLAAGVAVTPLGLDRPPVYGALYRHISSAFGQTQSMRCPHYLSESGRCGVWRHRESTCATWYCKHERGALGKAFWDRLRHLLKTAEESLARWCVLELDLGAAAVAALFPVSHSDESGAAMTGRDFDNLPDPIRHRRLWGRWAGREREFYQAAAVLARPLNWQQVSALGGSQLALQALLVREAFQALTSKDLPDRLKVQSVQFAPLDSERCLVMTYSPLDPLRMPIRLAQALHHFDGRPTREAVEAIERDHGFQVTASLVRKLVDYRILVPPADAPTL